MMQCDMCGSKNAVMVALIEGVELSTCEDCGRFGKMVRSIAVRKKEMRHPSPQQRPKENEKVIVIVPGYPKMIKAAREKLGLKQEDVARKISEKESMLHKIESGHHEPSVDLARKLEKFFHIKIVDEIEDNEGMPEGKGKTGEITIGDIINMKRR